MLQTALSIVQDVAYRLNRFSAPTALAAATAPGDLQLLHTLYDVCEELRREGPFRQQIMSYEFDTAATVATYPLPGDFYEAVPYTYYNQDNNWKLIGPLTDAEFQDYKEGEAATPSEYVWRIIGFDENSASTVGRQIELYPTPAATENLSLMYVTGHLFIPQKWTAAAAYTANTSYVNVNGRVYKCASSITAADTAPSGTGTAIADDDGTWNYYSAPVESLTADTDYCIFDGDVVKLGFRAKYFQDNDASELLQRSALMEYQRAIKAMRYRWEGQSRAHGDLKTTGGHGGPYVQPGSWSWV